ncbi:MAG: FAD-dependent oxidoreductase [Bacteroidales bacterium]|nr:FAD-dependent oxidoreductase [Bacteroidales bacterium]
MNFPFLFRPIRINSVEIRNRLIVPAMVTNFCNPDNTVSERLINYHVTRARGGFGLNIVEDFAVHPWGKGFHAVGGLWDDRFIKNCTKLTSAIHGVGGKVFIQIYHAGSQTSESITGVQPVAPSAFLHPLKKTLPRELTLWEIEEIIEDFGQAARRSRESGFDGVEIHGSHGYLVAQFMSSYTNRRTDRYGGDLLGRMCFPIDIIRNIRRYAGKDFPVIIRFAGDERISEGRTMEESMVVAQLLEEAGYDGLHVTTATTATQAYIVPPYYAPLALNVEYAEKIKKIVSIPVITTGRIHDPLFAEAILAQGRADMIGMGRASIADPDLPNKIAAGDLEDIRPCIACLQGCIGSLLRDECITCTVNPEVGREMEMKIQPAKTSKRVLVVGGGPGGMETARVAALKGHKVVLCEQTDKLGGQLIIAAMPPHKQGIAHYVKYLINQLHKVGVELRMNTEATVKTIREIAPDVVVVATGAEPVLPPIPGADRKKVLNAWDLLLGKVQTGRNVLVIGGGSVGCETADFLAVQRKRVAIVEILDEVGRDLLERVKYFLFQRLEEEKVNIYSDATVLEILEDGVRLNQNGKIIELSGYDNVVMAVGVRPRKVLVDQMKDTGIKFEVVGDVKKIGNALSAIAGGTELGRRI